MLKLLISAVIVVAITLVLSENSIRHLNRAERRIRASCDGMLALLRTLGLFICDLLKLRRRLQAENLFLRHQLGVALRRGP